ncbi:MAG: 2-phospho-L-lactate transferase [Chloroflexi bacterium]|nr:2-phospho-L-lactate transferase [Chloroflexota bacterium]
MALATRVAVLIGGVGGAKLASGLMHVVAPERLTFIVNTGDDFWRLGLKICPDLDTVMYTLAGLVNRETGWGIAGDETAVMDSLEGHYGVEPWFRLGDKDLATHLLRAQGLRQGNSLTEVTDCLARRLGVSARLLPMCDEETPTLVDTADRGELGFQEYFVKHSWRPIVKSIKHKDCEKATMSAPVSSALETADVILIAPSNPWLSVAPILAVPGMRQALKRADAPVVAITPIIAGAAVKGPTAKIMAELGLPVSEAAVARFYGGIIDGFVNDIRNEPLRVEGIRAVRLNTLMTDDAAKAALARDALDWIAGWAA